jgi:signal transduction histidine kinase
VLAVLAQVPASIGVLATYQQTPLVLRVLGVVLVLIATCSLLGARRWPGPVAVTAVATTVHALAILPVLPGPPLAAAFAVASAIIRGARGWAYAVAAGGWLTTVIVLLVAGEPGGGATTARRWGHPWVADQDPATGWNGAGDVPTWATSAGAIVLVTILGLLVVAVAERIRVTRDRAARRRLAEQRHRERSEQEERVRIARDLHDVIAHSLSQISVQAGVGLHLMDAQPERAREALTEIRATSGAALQEVRGALGLLRGEDAPVTPGHGIGDLSALAADMTGVQVRTDGVGRALEADLPAAVHQAVYRIVQEALTNVVRHAHADAAHVRIHTTEDAIEVEVTDDGAGAVPGEEGNGMLGMRERAELLGGSFAAGPIPTGGWRVHAVIPRGER